MVVNHALKINPGYYRENTVLAHLSCLYEIYLIIFGLGVTPGSAHG